MAWPCWHNCPHFNTPSHSNQMNLACKLHTHSLLLSAQAHSSVSWSDHFILIPFLSAFSVFQNLIFKSLTSPPSLLSPILSLNWIRSLAWIGDSGYDPGVFGIGPRSALRSARSLLLPLHLPLPPHVLSLSLSLCL